MKRKKKLKDEIEDLKKNNNLEEKSKNNEINKLNEELNKYKK